jgi:hypothetical protein
MARRNFASGHSKPLRVPVEIGTPGAYLWAPFSEHMKAGVVSLVPMALLNVVAVAGYAEGHPSILGRIMEGILGTVALFTTLGWVLLAACAIYCAGWAAMSAWLVRLLRRRPSFYAHLVAHAVTGAAITLALAMGVLYLAVHDDLAGASLTDADTFGALAIGAPAVGAIGAALGFWALRSSLAWYVNTERAPLKDVFVFVEGRHARSEFGRP